MKRVWAMLTQKERRRAGLLFIGIIINSFVDIIGLAAVVPVIGLVINPELITRTHIWHVHSNGPAKWASTPNGSS